MLVHVKVNPEDVLRELERRLGLSGHEKAARTNGD